MCRRNFFIREQTLITGIMQPNIPAYTYLKDIFGRCKKCDPVNLVFIDSTLDDVDNLFDAIG